MLYRDYAYCMDVIGGYFALGEGDRVEWDIDSNSVLCGRHSVPLKEIEGISNANVKGIIQTQMSFRDVMEEIDGGVITDIRWDFGLRCLCVSYKGKTSEVAYNLHKLCNRVINDYSKLISRGLMNSDTTLLDEFIDIDDLSKSGFYRIGESSIYSYQGDKRVKQTFTFYKNKVYPMHVITNRVFRDTEEIDYRGILVFRERGYILNCAGFQLTADVKCADGYYMVPLNKWNPNIVTLNLAMFINKPQDLFEGKNALESAKALLGSLGYRGVGSAYVREKLEGLGYSPAEFRELVRWLEDASVARAFNDVGFHVSLKGVMYNIPEELRERGNSIVGRLWR